MNKMIPLNAYRKELKAKILELARQQFAAHGVNAVKMGELATTLGISKRTLYEIYDDKQSLLLECLEARQREFLQHMQQFVAEGKGVVEIMVEFFHLHMQNIKRINPLFFEEIHRYPVVMKFIEERNEGRTRYANDFLQRGVAEGVIRSDVDFGLVLDILQLLQDQNLVLALNKKYPIDRLSRNIIALYLRGMCTQAGVAQLDALMERVLDEG